MQHVRNTLVGALAVGLAAGLTASPASADNIDLGELASILFLPVITGGYDRDFPADVPDDVIIPGIGDAVTMITITNGKNSNATLQLDLLSGDAGGSWSSTSVPCDLTGRETTTLIFTYLAGPQQVVMYAECSEGNDTGANEVAKFAGFRNGILVAALRVDAQTIGEDALFGDAVVIDTAAGQAYSFAAIGAQAGPGNNDGDKIYRFDNTEYLRFPSRLASNFIAPRANGNVRGELILFTPDGTVGTPPRAKVGGFVYNDDEDYVDFTHTFTCFDIVALEDLNSNFFYVPGAGIGLGSMSGHFDLTPQDISTTGNVHDDEFGDGNKSRRSAVHGWIAQTVTGAFLSPGEPFPPNGIPQAIGIGDDFAAWGRPLTQSTTDLLPFLADQDSTLNADVDD